MRRMMTEQRCGNMQGTMTGKNYRAVTDPEEARDYIRDAKVVAFDFEVAPDPSYRTEEKASLDPAKSHICTMSLSTAEGDAIMIPSAPLRGICMPEEEFLRFLRDFVTDRRIIKVCHNLAYEAAYCYALGLIVSTPVYDTICGAQMTLKGPAEFRKLGDCGLKTLAMNLCHEALPTFENVTRGRHFDEMDPSDPETIRYSCADADFALRLYYLENAWFDRFLPQHRWIVENLESPVAVYLGIMKVNGVPVDRERMEQRKAEAEQERERIRTEIRGIIGNIDIGSNAGTKDFRNYLFRELELPVFRKTESNRESLDDETMILLKEWCDVNRPGLSRLFELVQAYRKWGKITSTYIDGYMNYINTATGRIHPAFFSLSTDTGRFSCSSPNLQNMPRKNRDPVGVRNFIRAPEGYRIVSVDYSQLELRTGTALCRDPVMLETYAEGGDIHAMTTAAIFRIPYAEAADKDHPDYKERRTIAKNCNFGVFFGLYPKGLQNTLRFKAGMEKSEQECAEIIDSLKRGYPRLTRWQQETKAEAHRRKYSETTLGRRRYLEGIDSRDRGKVGYAERCALNTPVQGSAADIIKIAMGRILEGLGERPWLRPILQIHDELTFLVPEDRVEEAVAFIKKCMEERPYEGFDVPLVAEASVGKSFGELE